MYNSLVKFLSLQSTPMSAKIAVNLRQLILSNAFFGHVLRHNNLLHDITEGKMLGILNYFSFRRRPREIILIQHVETCL